jgi:probable phosphoglycerate mutase
MTDFFFIRHGANETVGHRIAGRQPGISLNGEGRAQARAVAEHISKAGIARIYSSPMERTLETAQIIGSHLGLSVQTSEDLNEVDFGKWTGSTFGALDQEPHWKSFNRLRSMTRVPGGELMLQTQTRMVSALEMLREQHPDERIAIVSHGDPIRSALIYYAGIPMDFIQRIRVDLASVSVLRLTTDGPVLLCVNQTDEVVRTRGFHDVVQEPIR